jgi:predicted acylesterase/phospholipase RssA
MGLTLIEKSSGRSRKRDAKVALVLAGGAVSGGAFKVGGLKALDDFLPGRSMTDLDIYVGLSAGSMLAACLASGVTPDELLEMLQGTSEHLEELRPLDCYNPNLAEFVQRPARLLYDLVTVLPSVAHQLTTRVAELPWALAPSVRAFVARPSYARAEAVAAQLIARISATTEIPALSNYLPTGLFDNSRLERRLRRNLERIQVPNDFRAFERERKRKLYITACDVDTAKRVIFGADERTDVTISQAVQASTALPLFYKPARINGADYIDGAIRHTANIDIAIEKGADLIICYNPFRPLLNRIDGELGEDAPRSYLSDRGLKVVLSQVLRMLLHSRLRIGIQRYIADDRFRGDIVLLEPSEQDADFFEINPFAFRRRAEAIQQGFESVRRTVEQNFAKLQKVFGRYGIEMDRDAARRRADWLGTARVLESSGPPREAERPPVGRTEDQSGDVLERVA